VPHEVFAEVAMEDLKPRSFKVLVPGVGLRDASAETPIPAHIRSLLRQDERQKFWIGRAWPEDAYGKVFLARAVERLGEALYPDEWTGFEPGVDTTLAPLPMLSPKGANWELAQALNAAVSIRNEVLEEIAAPRSRLHGAIFTLREAMKAEPGEFGAVRYYVLNSTTGDFFQALPHQWWNTTENWRARFYWCQIDLKTPITASVGGKGFQGIFVDGGDLEALIKSVRTISQAKNTVADQRALEAYLTEAVSDSPEKITKTFNEHIKPWMDANAPSITERGYREVRRIVLKRFPGNKWGKVTY